jgi:hypothetical protein
MKIHPDPLLKFYAELFMKEPAFQLSVQIEQKKLPKFEKGLPLPWTRGGADP